MTAEAAKLAGPISLPLRLAAWCTGPAAIAAAHFLLIELHPVARMWIFVGLLFFWMKAVVLAERSIAGKPAPSPLFAWMFLWPGMRPVASTPPRGVSYWLSPLLNGIASIVGACLAVTAGLLISGATWSEYAMVPFAMIAFSLVIHFGLFGLLTAGWRMAGFKAGPLFRNPVASRSLNDFWTRRWNLAYVEMCQEALLRAVKSGGTGNPAGGDERRESQPVAPKPARPPARLPVPLLVFVFSGLLHEVAISLPVNAGYGLPMLYFVLNGGAMLVGRKLREGGIAARAWAAFWVIAPLPLLFHPWFIRGIVLPMAGVGP